MVALLALLVASCADVPDTDQHRAEGAGADFASYAQAVYAELAREPLDSTLETETGLFGGMSVGEGESIVMGEYRFRVDSAEYGPVAHMAFQLRDVDGEYEPVPVVLQFVSRDDSWRLEEVAHYGAEPIRIRGGSPEAGSHDRDDEANPLLRSVAGRLDLWIVAAVERVDR